MQRNPQRLKNLLGRGSIERALWRGRKALGTMDRNASDNTHRRIGLILLFFASYIVSATVFQLRSETPPWVDSSPIEYFAGGAALDVEFDKPAYGGDTSN